MLVLRSLRPTNRWHADLRSKRNFACIENERKNSKFHYRCGPSCTARTEYGKSIVDSLVNFNPHSAFSVLVMRIYIFLMANREYGTATTGSTGFITSKSNRRKCYSSCRK